MQCGMVYQLYCPCFHLQYGKAPCETYFAHPLMLTNCMTPTPLWNAEGLDVRVRDEDVLYFFIPRAKKGINSKGTIIDI